MRYRKNRRSGDIPPAVDPAFAAALSGLIPTGNDNHRKPDHKTRQLCRQVQRALSLALASDGADAVEGLYIADVTPAPGPAHLLVHVIVPQEQHVMDAIAYLNGVAPRLRAEVARTITRKRAPELSFIPAAPEEVLS